MKEIIIFLLVIIALIVGYGQYNQYQRFSLENYEYKSKKGIDLTYHDKAFLLDYYEAVEDLNNYIITQWSANSIDVRVPESDDAETQSAAKVYTKKLANVKFYEDQLLASAELKKKGMTNQDVRSLEKDGISMDDKLRDANNSKLIEMFGNASSSAQLGDNGAFVYEIQKRLKSKGYDVSADGVFKDLTSEAIRDFEAKNKLFPDGKLDVFTLEKLLE